MGADGVTVDIFRRYKHFALCILALLPTSAHAAGLEDLLTIQATDVSFVEVTSRTLLRSGQIDFAAAIELDLPVTAQRHDLDELFSSTSPTPRFAIIWDVALAQTSRRVLKMTSEPSKVFLGYIGSQLSVPTDDAARTATGFVEPSPMAYASQALGQPILLNYAYDRAKIQARKKLTAYVYVVDRVAKTYIRSTVDVLDEMRFEVPYRLSRFDPRRDTIRNTLNTETAVKDYEDLELLIKLSDIVHDAIGKQDEAKSFTDLRSLRQVILKKQNTTLEKLAANHFDARPLNDPRFDSVVAIYTGKDSMGTGFFVAPDVVMTNWHVVKNATFVEMKLYDGRETFGTVLGKDAHLDVALVRIEHRGRPVAFHTGRTLNIGSSVEAIGHPRRLEFSITRGIISAVRLHFSIGLPKGAGEDVLYVQTDAPISPGNSGGPLFLGTRVVGMNTWSRTNAQNLNFAIHYSELLNFLNEHLPGFNVDPAQGG